MVKFLYLYDYNYSIVLLDKFNNNIDLKKIVY